MTETTTDLAERWTGQMAPGLDVFEALAQVAYADLPDAFLSLCGEISLIVADFPTDEVVRDMNLESPFDILGLFEGRGIGEAVNPGTGEMPNRIHLYRRPILDYWAEHEETLDALVSHVLIHEIGHHFGLSDDDMEGLEDEAG